MEGALYAWAQRHTMNPDGIAYLDITDAFLQGAWKNIVNGHWSPLYPALIALTRACLGASARWEFPIAHLTNLIIYVCALASFTFLLREMRRSLTHLREPEWTLIGCTFFMSCSLHGIGLSLLTPDLLVACLVFLASGLLLRIHQGDSSWRLRAFFGAALGLGFLAKAPMLPVAFIFLALAYVASARRPGRLRKALCSAVIFVLITAPYIYFLSKTKGRPTFGDSGRLNYMIFVDQSIDEMNWRQIGPGQKNAVHPLRLIFQNPAIYEFGTPVSGTYPPEDDPTYWTQGLQPTFDLAAQLRALKQSLFTLFSIIGRQEGSLLLGLFLVMSAGYFKRRYFLRQWVLWIPATGALVMFSFVLVASRYIAPYLLLVWLSLASAIRFPDNPTTDRWRRIILLLMLASPLTILGIGTVHRIRMALHEDLHHQEEADLYPWRVAELLKRSGVRENENLAVAGMDPYSAVGWARLARTRIIAQVDPAETDFFYDLSVNNRILPALAASGADAIIAQRSKTHPPPGWQPLGGTGLWMYSIPTPKRSPDRPVAQ